MTLTQQQAEQAIAAIRAMGPAANVIRDRGRAIHEQIRLFQRINHEAFDRLVQYQHYLGEPEDYWPKMAVYALDTFMNAFVSVDNVCIETRTRYPGDDYRYHRFDAPVAWLWMSDEEIHAALAAVLKEALVEVDAHDRAVADREEQEDREAYERLKVRFQLGGDAT